MLEVSESSPQNSKGKKQPRTPGSQFRAEAWLPCNASSQAVLTRQGSEALWAQKKRAGPAQASRLRPAANAQAKSHTPRERVAEQLSRAFGRQQPHGEKSWIGQTSEYRGSVPDHCKKVAFTIKQEVTFLLVVGPPFVKITTPVKCNKARSASNTVHLVRLWV